MKRGGYLALVVVAALVGAAVTVTLSLAGIGGAALDGAVGFCVVLWLMAWTNFRVRKSKQLG